MTFVVIVTHLLGLASSVHAVVSNRTAQGAIAWVVSLITFPYLALPLYWVFGRQRFAGYREAWSDRQSELGGLIEGLREGQAPFELTELEGLPNYEAIKAFANSRCVRGNDVALLVDGEATFDGIIAGIERADQYLLIQFYIVRDDGLGRRMKAAMIAAAKRGVKVFFLFDEIGSHDLSRDYLADLEAAGVRQSRFHSTRGRWNRLQLNFRNHRKTVVVDGRECWIGGHNVGDEYLGLDPKVGPWRDTHVHIVGPAAQQAQAIFLGDWYWAQRSLPELDWTPRSAPSGADVGVMVVPIAPTTRIETAGLFFVHALNAARDRIWLATPYFVPDPPIITALQLAAMRGVDVRIILPKKSDNPVVDLAAIWFAEQLDGLGIRFFRHTRGFMHQKVFLVDEAVSTVGSANFDNRSFRLQFEINALVVDRAFAREVEAMLTRDFERAEPYDPGSLRTASFERRVAASFARLASPLL